MSSHDNKENTRCLKKFKNIMTHLCLRLHAPIIRLLNQKTDAAQTEIGHLNAGMQTIRQQLENYENVVENIRNINQQLEGYENVVENIRNINQHLEGYEKLCENVRNTNQQLEGYGSLVENVRNTNQQLERYSNLAVDIANIKQNLESIAVNVRNSNAQLEQIDSTLDMHGVKIASLQKMGAQDNTKAANQPVILAGSDGHIEPAAASYGGIDYFDFENHFRGSRAQIKKKQEIYLEYFQGRRHVLDLGCGRGEFLELLKEHGIQAYGVDLYEEFVVLCRQKKLQAVQEDAIAFLEQTEKADGIFAGQLIEHLPLEQLIRLTELAYEKLEPGAFLILETPNPMSLAIYTNSFYLDPSHNKPVHPLTMRYLLEKAGFLDITVIFTESSRLPVQIPKLDIAQAAGIAEFNDAMKEVERTLFGSQDYAIIAKK